MWCHVSQQACQASPPEKNENRLNECCVNNFTAFSQSVTKKPTRLLQWQDRAKITKKKKRKKKTEKKKTERNNINVSR